MNSLNQCQIIGHLGSDPEVTQHGELTIAKFSVATNEYWKDKSTNEKKETTEWHRVVCFKKLGEISRDYLKKGAKVYVSGKLKTSKWQDKNNTDHTTTEVVVDDLIMLDKKPDTLADSKEGVAAYT